MGTFCPALQSGVRISPEGEEGEESEEDGEQPKLDTTD